MEYRHYDPAKDREAARRIWRETGWLEKDKEAVMDRFVESGRALVADLDGTAECLVLSSPGDLRYLDETLPFAAITGVTTSRIARQQGLAKRLTAAAVAEDAAAGALVSALGIFDQGYYNQLGFGTGSYEHSLSFDPRSLNVRVRPRVPRRLTGDDWELMHAARLARRRGHGGCNLAPAAATETEINWSENGFGLGYADDPGGALTHFFWCGVENAERGPYNVSPLVFRTADQLMELLALLKGLGDQVTLMSLREPPGIQFQDLIERPFRQWAITRKAPVEYTLHASAYWQMRVNDLPACLARTHLSCGEVRFNLTLTDPIAAYLPTDAPWRGVGGDYVVTLGARSAAAPGTDPDLPTLTASVGAFTRLWLGSCSATGLTFTDDLSGPPALLAALDTALRLPPPHPDWDF